MGLSPRNIIQHSGLFTNKNVITSIQANRLSIWQKGQQPLWPMKGITFNQKDDYRRRSLIRALTAPVASQAVQKGVVVIKRLLKFNLFQRASLLEGYGVP